MEWRNGDGGRVGSGRVQCRGIGQARWREVSSVLLGHVEWSLRKWWGGDGGGGGSYVLLGFVR